MSLQIRDFVNLVLLFRQKCYFHLTVIIPVYKCNFGCKVLEKIPPPPKKQKQNPEPKPNPNLTLAPTLTPYGFFFRQDFFLTHCNVNVYKR